MKVIATSHVALPATGQGLFGLHAGPALAIWTFVLHVIFGASMGTLAHLRLLKLDARR